MAPMSARLCLVSRYTVPRKLSGSDSYPPGYNEGLKCWVACSGMRGSGDSTALSKNSSSEQQAVHPPAPCILPCHAFCPIINKRAPTYLEQQAVDHDQVAHCELPLCDALARHHHRPSQRAAEDRALPPVERREALLRFQRGRLVRCRNFAGVFYQGSGNVTQFAYAVQRQEALFCALSAAVRVWQVGVEGGWYTLSHKRRFLQESAQAMPRMLFECWIFRRGCNKMKKVTAQAPPAALPRMARPSKHGFLVFRLPGALIV